MADTYELEMKEYDEGGGSSGEQANAYESIEEIENKDSYLFDVSYTDLDYGFAKKHFEKGFKVPFKSCSFIYKDGKIGRNFDWQYDNQAEFFVRTGKMNGRYAVSGVASTTTLSLDFVRSGKYSEQYKIVPFALVDGANEKGMTCSILVVPNDYKDTTGTIVAETREYAIQRINALMFVRYALDHFADIREVKSALQNWLSIYVPQYLRDMGYEVHFVFTDNSGNVEVLEFIANECQWTNITDKPVCTNYFLYGVSFKEDGTMYEIGDEGIDSCGLTARSNGMKRGNILINALQTRDDIKDIMASVKFSNTYTNDFRDGYIDEYCGVNGLTISSAREDFREIYEKGQQAYAERTRENPTTSQTIHTAIYDITNNLLSLFTQENYDDEYSFKLFLN